MGFKLTIDGREYQVRDFSVVEASTPLAAGDSSGQVGTLNFTISWPDPELVPNHPINQIGIGYLQDKLVRLDDSRKGFTIGKVFTATETGAGDIRVTAHSRLGELNVYNIQGQPFSGTLENAFKAYLALAGVDSEILVDPNIANKPVVFPGWFGELWFNLKQLAAAVDCDVSLVSGIIVLRPIRDRIASRGRNIDRTSSIGSNTLAQYIEIYQYNNQAITNKMVYPPGGWSTEVSVITLNAGEKIEEVLELSASVTSISQPTMTTFVGRFHDTSSVFTVVGDDGLPITPQQWQSFGGRLWVEINDDTTSLTLHVEAPTGLPNSEGELIQTYGIGLSDDSGTGRYSTLRILGTGTAFDKELVRFPTGISAQESATEVGVTIDNPFLSTRADVYRAALRAVQNFNGSGLVLSGQVTSINQLGDTGSLKLVTYAEEIDTHLAPATFGTVQADYAGKTYQEIQDELNSDSDSLFENQVFGNAAGARVWSEKGRRWYRIREATLTPSTITITAESDLTFGDMQEFLEGNTFGSVQARYNGLTYREVNLMGMR